MIHQFKSGMSIFNQRERVQLFFIFLLMLITAFSEAIGIGLILPFLAIVTNPSLIDTNPLLAIVYNFFPFSAKSHFIVFLGFGLIIIFITKNAIFFLSQYVQQNYFIRKKVELAGKMFHGYMHSKYELHLNTNPSLLFRNVDSINAFFDGFLQPLFEIVSEVLIILGICVTLFYTDWRVTTGAFLFLVIPLWLTNKMVSLYLSRIGATRFALMAATTKVILEGLHGIKEIMVIKQQNYFADRYMLDAKKLGYADRDFKLITIFPKLIAETLLIASISSFVVVIVLYGKNISEFIPILGLFGVAALRMINSLNKVSLGFQRLKFNQTLNQTIISEMSKFAEKKVDPKISSKVHRFSSDKSDKMDFNKLELKNINFRYETSKDWILNNISLQIKSGESVGIVGESGAGKSTLMDVLLGLLEPQEGQFLIDDQEYKKCAEKWANLVGYIPQSIYLRDDTLKNNIAFGIDEAEIKDQKIEKAIEIAQLQEVVKELPSGLDTLLGERGVRLSGGQRQRVAIARALYHNPKIILMDEATSALDNQTESEFIKAIERLQGEKTLVIIAHRLSTIQNCDMIYFLKDGKINGIGQYRDLLVKNENFQKMAKSSSIGVETI